MPRSSLPTTAALLLAGALALLAGAWFGLTSPQRGPPPPSAAIRPHQWLSRGDGRPGWSTPDHIVLRAQLWTDRFRELQDRQAWEELAALLADLESRAPVLYRANRLGYLHARALLGEIGRAHV